MANYVRGRKSISTTNPSQRPGIAHLCVNGRLICGIKCNGHRYYRSHEYFLNQVEVCPDCKKKFIETFGRIQ